MMQELIYTSAPRGLKPGTRGFCTVACTQQMTQPLVERLESLSGYRHLYAAHEAQAQLNPVIHSHLIVRVGGRNYHVLSRIADAGLDYTQRSNKFAHHVALDDSHLPAGGPAWLLTQPGFLQAGWEGEPKLLPAGRHPPDGFAPPAVCRHWQTLTGDAGWAGVLAETAADPTMPPACLLFNPGQDVLPLVAEALALLPIERRWQVTFSTWYTKLPPGVDCQWRFLAADTAEAKAAQHQRRGLWIDLTAVLPPAGTSKWVEAARSGVLAAVAQPAPEATAPAPADVAAPRASVTPPRLPAAEFGLDLAATPAASPPPTPILRASNKSDSNWKLWAVGAAVAALMLFTTAVGVVAFYVGRVAEKRLAQVDNRAPVLSTETTDVSSAAPGVSSAAPAASNSTAADATSGTQFGRPSGPPAGSAAKTDEPASWGTSGAGSAAERSSVQGESAGKELEGDSRKGESPDGDAAMPVAPENPPGKAGGKGPDAVGSAIKPDNVVDRLNPFAELISLGRRLSLPSASEKKALVMISPARTADFDLEIVGWGELRPNRTIEYQRREIDGRAEWKITEKVTDSPAQPAQIGTFSFEQERLAFQWAKKPSATLPRHKNPSATLPNCLLKLRVKQQDGRDCEEIAALRELVSLDRSSIHFNSALVDVALGGDFKLSSDINKDCLRLRVALSETGKDVMGAPVINPANGVAYCPEGGAGKERKTDVQIRIPFDQMAEILVKAHLQVRDKSPPAVVFNYRWKHQIFNPVRGIGTEDIALSIPAIKEYQKKLPGNEQIEQWNSEIKHHTEERNQLQKEISSLRESKDKEQEIGEKEKEVEELSKRITVLDQKRQLVASEPQRCDRLIKLLEALAKRIQIQVYYQFGKDEDEKMRVVLCETEQSSL